MRSLALLLTLSFATGAQEPTPDRLAAETRAALEKNDLTSAADFAARLDDEVARRYQVWLIRDANERVEETLRWLPEGTESFWVNQGPFVADAERPDVVMGRANRVYATDRLRALDGGTLWKKLEGKTIRIVTAGAKELKPGSGQIPAVASQMDITYFYFFAEPIDVAAFPVADSKMSGKPVWKAVGAREDQHWYSLARPDLLILATRRDSLDAVLRRVAGESGGRAMPTSLPEWRLLDRTAGFWGLRKTGVALSYDAATEKLEIRCRASACSEIATSFANSQDQFQMDRTEPGLLRMTADIKARGDFPFHYGMELLGMGLYR